MKNMLKYYFVMIFLTSSTFLQAAEVDIKPGLWEWSMTMKMQGMMFAIPPTTYSSCITKEDIIPAQSYTPEDCKMISKNITSKGVEWKMECSTDGMKTMSVGKINYTKTTAKGTINITTAGVNMVSDLSGRRIGECKK